MIKLSRIILILLFSFIPAACAQKTPVPAPVHETSGNAYVAPQSAPVLPPSWPSLGGPVIQMDTATIPLVQGQ